MRTGFRINKQAFLRNVKTTLSPSLRRGLSRIGTKKAKFGIRGNGDLPIISGVLNYGDPHHSFPNNLRDGSSPIPARPWLSNSTKGLYAINLSRYINDNMTRVVSSIPKRGQSGFRSSSRSINPNDFVKGLANVGAENARSYLENANFVQNSDATLANKKDTRPLHDTGKMSMAVEGWTE